MLVELMRIVVRLNRAFGCHWILWLHFLATTLTLLSQLIFPPSIVNTTAGIQVFRNVNAFHKPRLIIGQL
jgi:hypothetical protein